MTNLGQAADQLPWFHVLLLLTKVSDVIEWEWSFCE
jgi:hypothetical protein